MFETGAHVFGRCSDVLMDVTGLFEVPFLFCFYNFQIEVSVCLSQAGADPGILLLSLGTQRRTQKVAPGPWSLLWGPDVFE